MNTDCMQIQEAVSLEFEETPCACQSSHIKNELQTFVFQINKLLKLYQKLSKKYKFGTAKHNVNHEKHLLSLNQLKFS